MIKKVLTLMIMSLIFCTNIYSGETSTTKPKPQTIENLTKAIELNPKDANAYYKRGTAYYKLKEYDKAIADYNRAIELDPKNAETSYIPGIAYCIKNDPDRAIQKFTKEIELNPKNIWAYFNRAIAYYLKNDVDRTIEDFTRVIELDPAFIEAYRKRGDLYSLKFTRIQVDNERKQSVELNFKPDYTNEPNLCQAIEDYSKVIELDPNDTRAYYSRESAYSYKGDYDHAIEDCNKIIELNPKDARAYITRAGNYHIKGDYDYAIEDYDKAIELDPKNADAYSSRGHFYFLKSYRDEDDGYPISSISSDLDQAIEDYAKAIELQLKFPTKFKDINAIRINGYYSYIAIAYHRRGTTYARRRMFTSACDDFYQAGILYLKQNMRTEALECVDAMKQADPTSPLIQKLMDKIYGQK